MLRADSRAEQADGQGLKPHCHVDIDLNSQRRMESVALLASSVTAGQVRHPQRIQNEIAMAYRPP